MVKFKIDKNKKNEPLFKLEIKDEDIAKYRFIKRAIMESKKIKGRYNYQVPIRFFEVILKNIPNDDIEIDKNSILESFEFSDDYDENYYYILEVNPKYMKYWRSEGCPNIYKISIDYNLKELKKQLTFKKISKINI